MDRRERVGHASKCAVLKLDINQHLTNIPSFTKQTPYTYSRIKGKNNGGGSGWSDDGKVMYDHLFAQAEPDNVVWENIQSGAPEKFSTTTQQR